MLAAAFAAVPAAAEDVPFKGRTLDVVTGQEASPILRMAGTQYVVRRDQAQIIEQARGCLGGQDGVAVESADAGQGVLVANVSVGFRARFSSQTLQSRLTLQASDGAFLITESELGLVQGDDSGGQTRMPLTQEGSAWEKGLEALIQVENALVDCLYK